MLPFQVFNTYSNEDYDRRNEEVDPVASSAEYELEKRVEKLELFPVELEKGGKENMRKSLSRRWILLVTQWTDSPTYRMSHFLLLRCEISLIIMRCVRCPSRYFIFYILMACYKNIICLFSSKIHPSALPQHELPPDLSLPHEILLLTSLIWPMTQNRMTLFCRISPSIPCYVTLTTCE